MFKCGTSKFRILVAQNAGFSNSNAGFNVNLATIAWGFQQQETVLQAAKHGILTKTMRIDT